MLGYGLVGVCRRWLVWPAAMIWPSNLVNCALVYTYVSKAILFKTIWEIGSLIWLGFMITVLRIQRRQMAGVLRDIDGFCMLRLVSAI
jgi:hypothetical protein